MLLQRRISSNRLDRTPGDILRTVACDIFPIRFMNISIATYQQPKPHDLSKDRLIRTVQNNVVNRAYCWDSKDNPANWDSYPLPLGYWRSFSRKPASDYEAYDADIETLTCRSCSSKTSLVADTTGYTCSSCNKHLIAPSKESETEIASMPDGFLFLTWETITDDYTEKLTDWAEFIRFLDWARTAYDTYIHSLTGSDDSSGSHALQGNSELGLPGGEGLSGESIRELIIEQVRARTESAVHWLTTVTVSGMLRVTSTSLYGAMLQQVLEDLEYEREWIRCLGPATSRSDACTNDVIAGGKHKRFCGQNCYRKWRRAGGQIRPWMDNLHRNPKPVFSDNKDKEQLSFDFKP